MDEGGAVYRMTIEIADLQSNSFTGSRSVRPRDKGKKDSVAVKGEVTTQGLRLEDLHSSFQLWGDLQPASRPGKRHGRRLIWLKDNARYWGQFLYDLRMVAF